jgi:prepilin-type N-terminal cleavage/methylation domain-containing protein
LTQFQRNKGFTLVEILLALSIFALVGVCMQSVFYNGIRLSRHTGADQDTNHQMVLAFELLEKDLQNIIAFDFSGMANKATFKGEGQMMEFVTRRKNALWMVRYSLSEEMKDNVHQEIVGATYQKNVAVTEGKVQSAKTVNLTREEVFLADYLKNNFQWVKEEDKEIIASAVVQEQFSVEYGYYNDQDELSWSHSWDKDSVPQVVRLTLPLMQDPSKGKTRSIHKLILIPIGSLDKKV